MHAGQPSLYVWMQGHARTVPNQDDATDNDYHKYCNEKSPHTPRHTSPSTKHATKKSTGTRCFNAWSNTEIGRISFYFKGTVSSMLSLSPPKFRTKWASPKGSTTEFQKLIQQADRVRPTSNTNQGDDDVWPALPSPSPKRSRARPNLQQRDHFGLF